MGRGSKAERMLVAAGWWDPQTLLDACNQYEIRVGDIFDKQLEWILAYIIFWCLDVQKDPDFDELADLLRRADRRQRGYLSNGL